MSPYLGEFLGTATLMLLGSGVVAGVLLPQSKSQHGGWIVITVAWGLAVLFGIYAAAPSGSGAHMNCALTIALAALGKFPWAQVPGYVAAQLSGAAVGSTLAYLAYLPHWNGDLDPLAKRAVFCTAPAIRNFPAAILCEAIGSFVLMFGVLVIGANKMTEGLAPFAVAGLVVAIGLSLGGPTGYAINPARDLGPRIAHALLPIPGKADSDWAYAWVPVVAPIAGMLMAAGFWQAFYA